MTAPLIASFAMSGLPGDAHPILSAKWLISRRMAEMSHPPADIFFQSCEFQLCRRFRRKN